MHDSNASPSNNSNSQGSWLNLPNLGLSVKALFTGYILVVGMGLMMAGAQILLTHGMADGKFGLSVNDIVYSYYGNRGNSRLEAKLNGSMKDKAPVDVRAQIIEWVQKGSPNEEWEGHINPLFQQHCVSCHGVIPGLPNFNSIDAVHKVAEIDTGTSIDSLTRVSHIHLFGIAFIFFFVGFIFSMAVGIQKYLKAFAIFLPFCFLLVDIVSWWLTKWSPNFAWLTIIGGFGYSLASTFMLLTSLYQMWILPLRNKTYTANTWLS